MLAYPWDRAAYGRLCRLLTKGNLRAPKGECWLDVEDLMDHGEALQIVGMPLPTYPAASRPPSPARAGEDEETLSRVRERAGVEGPLLAQLSEAFGDRLSIGASLTYGEEMRGALARRAALSPKSARRCGRPTMTLMHVRERRPLTDVLACIREGTNLEAAELTQANAERHLKGAEEMTRLFAEAPEAVEARPASRRPGLLARRARARLSRGVAGNLRHGAGRARGFRGAGRARAIPGVSPTCARGAGA